MEDGPGTALWEEKLAGMPDNYGVVQRVLRRNVSRTGRNWDIKTSPPEPALDGSVPAVSFEEVFAALESIEIPVRFCCKGSW